MREWGVAILMAAGALGIPQRGNHPWTMILCKFSGQAQEPRSPEWFRSWLTDDRFPGSLNAYFTDVSNGLYTIKGSNVVGWLSLPWSREDIEDFAKRDPALRKLTDLKLKFYYKTKELCLGYARNEGYPVHANVINVVNDESTAVFCRESGVLLTPKFFLTSALAHEITHSLNIGHSYSDAPVKIFPYSEEGEYDDKYDLMSTANAYMHPATFGMTGPGLNGPHLDYLGWLPANRLLYFGGKGRKEAIVRLASLSAPHAESRGYLVLYLPYDRDDPSRVFTLEFRTPAGNDKGIKEGAVVIHKLDKREAGVRYSYLVTHGRRYYELIRGTEWTHTLPSASNNLPMQIRIRFLRTSARFHSADVHVITSFDPTACLTNEVERRITPDDQVCVDAPKLSPLNLHPPVRKDLDGFCPRGLVGREAVAGDDECVEEAEKAKTDADNAAWHRRAAFFTRQTHTFGLNGCRHPDLVWRLIDAHDYTCVPLQRRRQVAEQNSMGKERMDKGGDCNSGFVHRRAFQGDEVCVTVQEAGDALDDNLRQPSLIDYYSFFNGVDDVAVPSIHQHPSFRP